eukprot:TRINITY_DN984_c0_g1_i5.p1 TRINITY_DN984_c0_g1~~TRINITY_DN984_c0_g1_i5.p1  ORF type:complete len:110 (+),score=2.67 TRINITY_DN984_c0_g1_i5:158-487(+)
MFFFFFFFALLTLRLPAISLFRSLKSNLFLPGRNELRTSGYAREKLYSDRDSLRRSDSSYSYYRNHQSESPRRNYESNSSRKRKVHDNNTKKTKTKRQKTENGSPKVDK